MKFRYTRRYAVLVLPLALWTAAASTPSGASQLSTQNASRVTKTSPCKIFTKAEMSSLIGAKITYTSVSGKNLAKGIGCTYDVNKNLASAGFGVFSVERPFTSAAFKHNYLCSACKTENHQVQISGIGQIAARPTTSSEIDVLKNNTLYILTVDAIENGTSTVFSTAQLEKAVHPSLSVKFGQFNRSVQRSHRSGTGTRFPIRVNDAAWR